MKILAIETSCDETAAAVVENGRHVLSNIIYSQRIHSKFGGIVPELASRAHLEKINIVVEYALKKARTSISRIDAVAFTSSPGLIGSLLVGQITAEAIAYIFNKRLIGVNHLEGHIFSPLIEHKKLKPPFLSLTVSGGHTDLVIVKDFGLYEILGRTRDDAAGEAFDKVAKLLNLKYPGGPSVEKFARKGNPEAIKFSRPYMFETWDFSFSGIKTAVLYYLQKRFKQFPLSHKTTIPVRLTCDICASFQDAVTDTLVEKTFRAAKEYGIKKISVGGGVASNGLLKKKFYARGLRENISVYVPSPAYCTDNAAMMGCAAYYRLKYGMPSDNNNAVSSDSTLVSWMDKK